VVTRDIPPNTVAAGNPARVIANLDEYLVKIRSSSAIKGVFGEDYLMHNINLQRRLEIIDNVRDSIGFIV
jgi:hypothetical protein